MNRKILQRLPVGLTILLGVLGMTLPPVGSVGNDEHKFHTTYGRMGVEENIAVVQVRFFKDDLYETLVNHYEQQDFSLSPDPETDRMFVDYFNERFRIEVDGTFLTGLIVSSGEDVEGQEEVWWYVVQFVAEDDLTTFSVTNSLLTELFDDQKNILKVQHFPSEKTLSYYFDVDTTVLDVDLLDG